MFARLDLRGNLGELVDVGGLHAVVVDIERILARQPLAEAVQGGGVEARHLLFLRRVGPCGRCHHEKASFGAGVEVAADRFLQPREALVLQGDERQVSLQCLAGDLPLAIGNARADDHGAMRGGGDGIGQPLAVFRRSAGGDRLAGGLPSSVL